MRAIIVVLLLGSLVGNAIAADHPALAIGQVWRIENPPSPETRVIIGRIDENDGATIVHLMVRGMPDLQRDPGKIKLLGKRGMSSEAAGVGRDQFICHYTMKPSADSKTISIHVQYLPIEYPALAASLSKLETTGENIHADFERSLEKWDYLKEPFEGDYREVAAATRPLSETLAMVRNSANSTLNMMERIEEDIFGADRDQN